MEAVMAFNDPMFRLGMVLTLSYRGTTMGRTNDLYGTIENLVYEAIENGASNVWDIYGYVTRFIPHTHVTHEMVEKIADEYSAMDDEPNTQNVPYYNLSW
jgi:hypothetical protein